jgi:alkylation response protein AidB-like acyl-CoA dehydrogenase
MQFDLTPEQQQIKDAIEKVCAPFDADYWLKKDQEGGFPDDFHRALADDGWLTVCGSQAINVASVCIHLAIGKAGWANSYRSTAAPTTGLRAEPVNAV